MTIFAIWLKIEGRCDESDIFEEFDISMSVIESLPIKTVDGGGQCSRYLGQPEGGGVIIFSYPVDRGA